MQSTDTVAMAHKRATIIYNPMSGRPGRRAENVRAMVRLLEGRGINAEGRATAGPDDATRIAREAIRAGTDIIVSYGGDGTLNEVIQAMAGGRASLAVWAGGTANVVARDLAMPFKMEQLADVIAAGRTKRITLGVARAGVRGQGSGVRKDSRQQEDGDFVEASSSTNEITSSRALAPGPRPLIPDPRPLERYFLMFAGIGLDASIARKVNKRLKRRTGEFAYWVEGIKHLATWQAETFVIDVDGKEYEGVFALIGNGKGYGGGMSITRNARLEEDWFEVFILPRQPNNLAYLRDLASCMRGKAERTGATIVRGRHVTANSTHEPWVEVDGELIGPLPMSFDIVPDALSIIVP